MSISASSGVISGIDYGALVRQLVDLERIPLNLMETRKRTLEGAKTAYSTLNSRLSDLKSAADALRTESGFKVFKASVSDSTALSATATSSASSGTYNIVVTSLANSHKIAADGAAGETSTIASGAGSFKFIVGSGAEQSVNVDATTTLAGLRDSINALDAGVTATIINDGSGATPYRLILSADTTGASNAINITQNDTTLLFNTTLQSAQDAAFTVDNMSFARSSNTFSDVINGVSVTLKTADAAKTQTLTVERDTGAISKKVAAFIDKYNSVMSFIKTNNRYDSETKKAEPFFGESIARSVADDLRRAAGSSISGLSTSMNRLIHIGVTRNDEGVLALDSSKLTDALTSDFNGVVNLFIDSASTDGFGALVFDKVEGMLDFVDGRLTGKQKGLDTSIKKLTTDIDRNTDNLLKYEERIRLQFTALETLLSGLTSQSSFLKRLAPVQG
ncbi:MAG: flagellar filament capping protein FliD [Deltaproteobacteria bacterium]|nr:flagellar filament capping protein FliD [Deltaproteobacteria bacterium]